MKTILIDTHVLDSIHDDVALREDVCDLVRRGEIVLLITHHQRDEVAAMSEGKAERREALLALADELTQTTGTKGAVFGMSRFGEATYDDGVSIDYLRKRRRDPNATRDALIFNTATRGDIDLFVSDDARRVGLLARMAAAPRVLGCAEFKVFIRTLRGSP